MQLDLFQKYLIAINILCFCLITIDFVKYLQTGNGIKRWWICDIVIFAGGSLGLLIAELLWDRKIVKKNIAWRFYTITMLIIHIAVYFFIYGVLDGKIKWNGFKNLIEGIQRFGVTHNWLWYYLLIINLVTFVAFAIDKVRAIQGRWRIREITLLILSLIGGAIGGMIAMYTIRHKTKVVQFYFGLPMMLLAQAAVLVYWIARTI